MHKVQQQQSKSTHLEPDRAAFVNDKEQQLYFRQWRRILLRNGSTSQQECGAESRMMRLGSTFSYDGALKAKMPMRTCSKESKRSA